MNLLEELRTDVLAASEVAIHCLPISKANITLTLLSGEDAGIKMTSMQARIGKDVLRCIAYAQEAARRVQEAKTASDATTALQFARLAEGIERRYAHLSTNTPPLYADPEHLTMTPLVMLCYEFETTMKLQLLN